MTVLANPAAMALDASPHNLASRSTELSERLEKLDNLYKGLGSSSRGGHTSSIVFDSGAILFIQP